MSEPWVVQATGCPDCGGPAEPEEEDGLRKYVCTACEYEFGFQLLQQAEPEGSCQLGVPEEVRRRASVPPRASEVFIGQIGRRAE